MVADGLDRSLVSLENCISASVAAGPATAQCTSRSLPDLQREILKTSQTSQLEKQKAKGVQPGILVGPFEKSSLPDTPVLYQVSQMTLVGALIGFLVGLILVQPGVIHWFTRRSR